MNLVNASRTNVDALPRLQHLPVLNLNLNDITLNKDHGNENASYFWFR